MPSAFCGDYVQTAGTPLRHHAIVFIASKLRYHQSVAPPRFVAKPFFEPPSEALRFLPEGPRVLQNHPHGPGLLGWVAIQHAADLKEGSLNVLNLSSGENHAITLPGRPGFFCETQRPGIVLVGMERTLIYCNLLTGGIEETGITVTDDQRVIINDGLAIEGGVLFGTKHLEFNQTIAALYHFNSSTRKISTVVDGQICSNGKFLKGTALIDIDSTPKTITRYHLDAGLTQVLDRSVLIDPAALPGFPDGMRPAPDGKSVIIAYYNPDHLANGLAQQICLESSVVLCEWELPGSPRVTCPEFVEIDGKVMLLFTTAVEGMSVETRAIAPGAGSLYIAETLFQKMPDFPPLMLP
jgi:sugar lactone lactonase YvrE